MGDIRVDLEALFKKARMAAAGSKEQAGNMRKALKVSRQIVKECGRLQKAARKDERHTKPDELPAIKKDLEDRLASIKALVGQIWALEFVGAVEVASRLDAAVSDMEKEFTKNWPVFEEEVKKIHA